MDYESGKIDYDEFMSRDIALWKPTPSKEKIQSLLLNYTLNDNVKEIINTLKEKEYELFIVTTAPDILANSVATELGIEHVACNFFIFDNQSLLTTRAVFNVDLFKKDLAFKKLLQSVGLNCLDCIAIGDSKYDISFLKSAGLGVAFNPDDILKKEKFPQIINMMDLTKFI
jgi:HAD superfamily phosphoserine phosphatase-like hydrolase